VMQETQKSLYWLTLDRNEPCDRPNT
jgi:hypothetical protein